MSENRQSRAVPPRDTKRQNFIITPEQDAEIARLRESIDAPRTKDTILCSVRVLSTLAREARQGHLLYVGTGAGKLDRI